ncbi:hypothetical protein HK099_008384 [Clydaea vesicula]|uniref:P21-activated protein kinase-interacting protein 1-like n=1 Tax=Clydaea vesicula TaxID=447962 RepID=A0AAD5XXZ2_9FUNG|nr:hypothetical protein HK099_008384 [Clydaea vesicula]
MSNSTENIEKQESSIVDSNKDASLQLELSELKQPSDEQLPVNFQLILGSYERLLYGFDCILNKEKTINLIPSFVYPSHLSCVKTLASTKRFLASGSTDEHIKLYDIKLKKEIGTLMLQHEGTITCLNFFSNTHLLSASEDGNIAIFRTSDWERLKTLAGHKGGVNWVDCHPSGKIALSVGKDQTLKCWDLIRGLCARSTRLKLGVAERVFWSNTGDLYAVLYNNNIEIVNVEEGKTKAVITMKERINSMVFTVLKGNQDNIDDIDIIVFGCENGMINVWKTDGSLLFEFHSTHKNRVKDIDVFNDLKLNISFLATCSTDGGIKVWNLTDKYILPETEIKALGEHETKVRLTCLSFAQPGKILKIKEKKKPTSINNEIQSDFEEDLKLIKKIKKKPTVSIEIDGNVTTNKEIEMKFKKNRKTFKKNYKKKKNSDSISFTLDTAGEKKFNKDTLTNTDNDKKTSPPSSKKRPLKSAIKKTSNKKIKKI